MGAYELLVQSAKKINILHRQRDSVIHGLELVLSKIDDAPPDVTRSMIEHQIDTLKGKNNLIKEKDFV